MYRSAAPGCAAITLMTACWGVLAQPQWGRAGGQQQRRHCWYRASFQNQDTHVYVAMQGGQQTVDHIWATLPRQAVQPCTLFGMEMTAHQQPPTPTSAPVQQLHVEQAPLLQALQACTVSVQAGAPWALLHAGRCSFCIAAKPPFKLLHALHPADVPPAIVHTQVSAQDTLLSIRYASRHMSVQLSSGNLPAIDPFFATTKSMQQRKEKAALYVLAHAGHTNQC
eukprot:GHRQ01001919.1.p1 GENE.GHRQ01001919.1~~GHRQ01001919.1.p1  ORF type:complete len:224 (-),score=36.58 GHRQ01001919.1:970-1641(-)